MNRTYVIAEAGVNHNGNLSIAKKLIDEAVHAGADAVKFQYFKAEKLVTKSAKKADYQITGSKNTKTQFDMLQQLELDEESFVILKDYCDEKGIDFLTSAFDIEGIEFLKSLGMKYFKIPSGEITNLPYLRAIANTGINSILSTGMSTYSDIENALSILQVKDKTKVTVLQCNTDYPTRMVDVNLKAMNSIKKAFNVQVGYSDHTNGIEIPIAAVALGATVIEKHFTLDKTLPGPDHKASLEPNELAEMISAIRNIELALGDGVKRLTDSERKNLPVVRKSIVASKNIGIGEYFTEDNIEVKRPGTGLSPMDWDNIIGKKSKKAFKEDEVIEL